MSVTDVLRSIPSDRIVPNMHCPKVDGDGLNWNTAQCILRIDENNACVYGCPISKKICEEYGWDVREAGKYQRKQKLAAPRNTSPKPRKQRKSFGKLSGGAWKGLLEHEMMWGHETLWWRNRRILVSTLVGTTTLANVAEVAGVTKPRVNQIVKNLCFSLNPKAYIKLFGTGRFKIKTVRDNKRMFLRKLPIEYPQYEGEEDA